MDLNFDAPKVREVEEAGGRMMEEGIRLLVDWFQSSMCSLQMGVAEVATRASLVKLDYNFVNEFTPNSSGSN